MKPDSMKQTVVLQKIYAKKFLLPQDGIVIGSFIRLPRHRLSISTGKKGCSGLLGFF